MKTLKKYKSELMKDPAFAAAYEEVKAEMRSIALNSPPAPLKFQNANKRRPSMCRRGKKYLVRQGHPASRADEGIACIERRTE